MHTLETTADALHRWVRQQRWLVAFTWLTRILLALAFLPSGITKILGNRFTVLSVDTSIGFFFEGMYQSGAYWQFIGIAQLFAAVLLLIPFTSALGALVYFPIILNIFIITVSLQFTGTPYITGLMLLGSVYLLCWEYDRWKPLLFPRWRGETYLTKEH